MRKRKIRRKRATLRDRLLRDLHIAEKIVADGIATPEKIVMVNAITCLRLLLNVTQLEEILTAHPPR
jgi:hypothetical protein